LYVYKRVADRIVPMRKGAAFVAIAAVAVAGCGNKSNDDGAASQVRGFLQAASAGDGAGVCATLTRSSQKSVQRLATAQGRPDLRCSGLIVRQLQLAGLPTETGALRTSGSGSRFAVHAKGLEADTATGVRVAEEDGVFRITLVDVAGVKQVLKAGRRCAAARRAVLGLRLPPARLAGWPAYMERAARLADRTAALDVEDPQAMLASADRLRALAKAMRADGASAKRMRRAVEALREFDARGAAITFARADCGENPRSDPKALEFQDVVAPSCVASKRAAAVASVVKGKKVRAALQLRVRTISDLASDAARPALPKVLDGVRDSFVADARRQLRVTRDQLAAFRAQSLQRYFAASAGIDTGALVGRFQLALARLGVPC
jgi:hypothetical protein